MPEAVWFKLCGHGWLVQHGIVALFSFGGRDISDGLQQSPVVEPVDPFQGGVFDGLEGSPWSSSVYHLIGQRILTSQCDDASARCSDSNHQVMPNDF